MFSNRAMANNSWKPFYRSNQQKGLDPKIANRFPQFVDWLSPEGHGFPQFAVPFSIFKHLILLLFGKVKNQHATNNRHTANKQRQAYLFSQNQNTKAGANKSNDGSDLAEINCTGNFLQ